jgi:two-component system KDP operon response regulator KdpE
VEREGKIVPLQRLAKQVWGSDSIDSPAIKATVAGLRTKLGDNPHTPKIILAEHEAGYRLVRPEGEKRTGHF